jgi:N-acetylmuramic acid 6-phosphate etherase
MNLDSMSLLSSVDLMINEEYSVIESLKNQRDNIVAVISKASDALKGKGRIIYVGAGTSGRLGVLDAVECMPTFGVDANTVVGLMAGGEEAFIRAQEGAEDSLDSGESDLKNIGLTNSDIVIGIAASGRTPYVIGALKYSKSVGATTASISCSKNSKISGYADISIEAVPGPEVLTGSTRLKAGTTQKLILNMISTLSMVSIGKVYQNLMVDVQSTNKKLVERSKLIISQATSIDYETASGFYVKSKGSVKVAIVMVLNACEYDEAIAILNRDNNFIKR